METKNRKSISLWEHSQTALRSVWNRITVVIKGFAIFMTPRRVLLIGGISLFLLAGGLTISFFAPRTTSLSFSKNNCFMQPVLLPNLITKRNGATYQAEPVASISIAGYPLFSRTTCVTPLEAPKENTADVIVFGAGVFTKKILVTTGALPSAINQAVLESPVATQRPLGLILDSSDRIFDYRLRVNDKYADCPKQNDALSCYVAQLGLAQSTTYTVALERLFKGRSAGTLFEHQVTTVQAVEVTASSVTPGQTVFDVPTELTVTLNRPATTIEGARLYLVNGDSRQEVPVTATLQDQTVTVRFAEPLARSALYMLEIQKLIAEDGGFLNAPFALGFKTSGGPKVLGINIGSYKVSTGASVVITFDSAVSTTQAVENFVRLEAAGNAVNATVSVHDNKVTLKPHSALPRCTPLTVKVLDGLQNNYGISGGSAWQFTSRTLCQYAFSIGSSVQGRSITAYSFGTGSSKIVFVGTTHGDEKSSTILLTKWIDYLETNADKIPAGRTIVVIPNVNPDGYAMNRRTNANNVDLNRNFPANSWKQGVTMPDGSFNANGGGSAPLSEPESSALASYILGQNPRLVLTYHAAAGVVIPNDSGDSVALAQTYDQKSNLYFASNSQTGTIFGYDTTGAFEDWLHDKHDIATLLIELWTKSGNEFAKNQSAMWHMATLP